jgi:hypothetical protein
MIWTKDKPTKQDQTGAVSLSGVRIASITVIIMQKGQPMSDKIDKVMGEITSVIDFDYMRIRSILTSVFGEQSIPQDIHTVIADYEEVLEDQKSLVRELDVLLNGSGAAQQASLCDIVGQVRAEHIRSKKYIPTGQEVVFPVPQDVEKEIREKLIAYHARVWDCDNDPTYYEVVDAVLSIIRLYLAVNDRRALVKLREEVLMGWNESFNSYDDIPDGYTVSLRYLLEQIDTLLAG